MHEQTATTPRFDSTNTVSRALFAELDREIAERAQRAAKRRADKIKRLSLNLIKLSDEAIARLRDDYAQQLYYAVFESEAERMRHILNRAEDCR